MMRAYQLMIMRLVLLQEHQSHDHELGRAADHEQECAVAYLKAERVAARGKAGR